MQEFGVINICIFFQRMILKCLITKIIVIVTAIVLKHALAYGTVATSSVVIVVSCTKSTRIITTMNEIVYNNDHTLEDRSVLKLSTRYDHN